MRILVIAAHPDDEVIGAGGTIARHIAQGDDVFWCIVTEGYTPTWSADILAAAKRQVYEVQAIFGIEKVFFCGFPSVKLNTVPYMELSSALQRVVDEVLPHIVYTTPRGDINQDHRLVFQSTLVATRPQPGISIRRLLCYEIGPTARYGAPVGTHSFNPNVFVDISDFLDKKLEAMRCYKTLLEEYPHPRSIEGLRLIAKERGISVGLQAAECFHLIRELL